MPATTAAQAERASVGVWKHLGAKPSGTVLERLLTYLGQEEGVRPVWERGQKPASLPPSLPLCCPFPSTLCSPLPHASCLPQFPSGYVDPHLLFSPGHPPAMCLK